MIDKKRTACFVGHRMVLYKDEGKVRHSLDIIIEELYQKGVIFYGAGGAFGFDTMAAEAVIRARKRHREIKLIIVVPCKDYSKYWVKKTKKKYAKILGLADKVVCLSEKYYKGCILARNGYLINYSGYCVAYIYDKAGETALSIGHALRQGLEVIDIESYFKRLSIVIIDILDKIL